MTKEQIQNEAVEYAKGKYGGENTKMWAIAQIHAGRDGFIAGADWRINSVWHKPEEVPEVDKNMLIKSVKGCKLLIITTRLSPYWDSIVANNQITSWAYVEDLIPTEDERNS